MLPFDLRIDYILVSQSLVPHLASSNIQPEVMGSDHCPVLAELNLHVRQNRESSWTFFALHLSPYSRANANTDPDIFIILKFLENVLSCFTKIKS